MKDEWSWGSTFASSSLAYDGSYSASGSTTVERAGFKYGVTHTEYYCETNQGTVNLLLGDGSASSTAIICDTDGATSTAANGAFDARETIKIQIGSQTGDPDRILFDATARWTVN